MKHKLNISEYSEKQLLNLIKQNGFSQKFLAKEIKYNTCTISMAKKSGVFSAKFRILLEEFITKRNLI